MTETLAKTERLYIYQTDIYQNDEFVGELSRSSNGAVSFQYDTNCKSPISLSLPLQVEPHKGAAVFHFFENLLPDSKPIREKLAKNTGAVSILAFDLLQAIGHECVGALRFQKERGGSDLAKKLQLEPLTDSQIRKVLTNLETFPLGIREEQFDFRISVAGAQEKTALTLYNSQWHLPLKETPTTHLLKPPMGTLQNGIDLTTSVENEWLCLEICKAFGLKTANAQRHSFDGQTCLVVERFDRRWEGEVLLRIAQEDVCQALGIPPHLKYESDHTRDLGSRPDIKTLLQLLNQSDRRREDREQFFRSQIAFYVLAATDGHAKNFSLFLTPNQFRMAPIYDVMSVYPALQSRQIEPKQVRLAMSVGTNRHYRHSEIAARHYFQMAKSYGVPKAVVEKIIDDIKSVARRLESLVPAPEGFSAQVYESIVDGAKTTASNL